MNTVPSPRVAVVVLNYNSWEDTRECLGSVLSQRYPDLSLLVVDNGSRGGEAEKIDCWLEGAYGAREELTGEGGGEYRAFAYWDARRGGEGGDFRPGRAFLLASRENRGFARGNNMAIEFARDRLAPEFFMLLNNDVVLGPDCLLRLVDFAVRTSGAGSAQPRILSKGKEGVIDSLGQAVFSSGRARDIGQGERDPGEVGAIEVFGTCAAAALYRADAMREAGLLDERFFITLEDVDLAWRLRLCGYSAWCVTAAVAYHGRGITGSRRVWEGIDPIRSYHKNKNHLLLALKYHPVGSLLRYLHLNLFRFTAALVAGVCLGCIFPCALKGIMRERADLARRYVNMGSVRKRWLARG
ncbi:MAG: glycosyltransferase family 2 protein [Actinomycetota bacterium]|nr:glycosyltransferase family 2 protein [Actinomycetota bacterium]